MKKIIILCRSYYPDVAGGGEISTKTLAENLAISGYRVKVVCISDNPSEEIISEIPIVRLKPKNIYWSLKPTPNLAKKLLWHIIDSNNIFIKKEINEIFSSFNPDILISSTIEDVSSICWRLAKQRGIRVIHILRSYTLMCVNANMFKKDNCKNRCLECTALTFKKKINSNFVDDIVGISKFVLKKHIDYGYFSNAKKHVIYNICLDDVLEKKEKEIKSTNIIIGYLGRIHPTKGIEKILESLSSIPEDKLKSISLHIAGNGDPKYISYLKNISIKNGLNVKFLGLIPANEFLDSIDILVVPSEWNEPFGRVLIESFGRKTPVLASSSGGITELMINNEDFLFTNSLELTSKILKFVDGEIKFKFILTNFKTSTITEKWCSLLG